MSKLPSMPFFVDAYLGDTMHLTTEEHGAYMLLLMSMWRHSGAIPDDDADNSRICRMTVDAYKATKERLRPLLTFYGPSDAPNITQGRLQREWNRAIEVSARQAERGKKSGEVRRKQNQEVDSNRRLLGVQTANEPEMNRTRTPIPIKNKPTTSQEDRGAELEIPACLDRRRDIHRLLKTPAMRKTA